MGTPADGRGILSPMHRLYLGLAFLIMLIGVVHLGATTQLFDELNSRALWFASGGLLLILTGALNLLNRAHGAIIRDLRWMTVATNVVMTIFAAVAGVVGAASGAQLAVIVSILAATTFVSLRPRA
ncbi:hypothetical protein GCM10023325_21250 [Sphingomonas lutea]|nr:hypothetical protein [Sphingomonas lutea]